MNWGPNKKSTLFRIRSSKSRSVPLGFAFLSSVNSPHPLQAADVDDTALLEPGLASSVGKGCPTTGDKLVVSGGAGLAAEAYLHHCKV